MKLIWSPLSLQRIQEISDYIAEDNISAANRWIDELFEKTKIVKSNPEIGRIADESIGNDEAGIGPKSGGLFKVPVSR